MNNETTPEYSLPEGTIEEIKNAFDRTYDKAIDHAIEIVQTFSTSRINVLTIKEATVLIIEQLKKLKK